MVVWGDVFKAEDICGTSIQWPDFSEKDASQAGNISPSVSNFDASPVSAEGIAFVAIDGNAFVSVVDKAVPKHTFRNCF